MGRGTSRAWRRRTPTPFREDPDLSWGVVGTELSRGAAGTEPSEGIASAELSQGAVGTELSS